MKKILTIFAVMTVVATFIIASCGKEENNSAVPGNSDNNTSDNIVFSYQNFEYQGIKLPYREAVLNSDATGTDNIVVLLHGGTQRGNDNEAQLDTPVIDSLSLWMKGTASKTSLLVPQCAADRVWNESARTYNPTMTQVLEQWITGYVSAHCATTPKIYILGYSAGGSGTWRMVNDYPQLFAAAMPVAAKPLMVTAENIKTVPLYVVAGQNDRIMDISAISSFVDKLRALNCELCFDTLPNADHETTCKSAFAANRLQWLFAH